MSRREHFGVGLIARDRAATRFYLQQKDAAYRRYPLAYSLFGGAIERGETAEDGLARELVEELGRSAAWLLAAPPRWVGEYRVGPRRFRFGLFDAIVDDAVLDVLAKAPVFEGERGAVVGRAELASLPFVWGLEVVVLDYLARIDSAGTG